MNEVYYDFHQGPVFLVYISKSTSSASEFEQHVKLNQHSFHPRNGMESNGEIESKHDSPRYIRDAGPELVGLEGEEFLPPECEEMYPQIRTTTIDLHVRNIMAANYSFLKYWQCSIMAANYIAYKWGQNKSYSQKWGPKWKYNPK